MSNDEPKGLDDFQQKYKKLQFAYDKLELDQMIQREEYELKFEKLNDQIIKLNSGNSRMVSYEEVQRIVNEKDRNIKMLQELVTGF